MHLVKIPAMSLQPGMFVAEVDRPWLETPFAMQGFCVRDQKDVLYVSNYVDQVYVDTEYKGTQVFLSLASEPVARRRGKALQLKTDFQQARVSFESAANTASCG